MIIVTITVFITVILHERHISFGNGTTLLNITYSSRPEGGLSVLAATPSPPGLENPPVPPDEAGIFTSDYYLTAKWQRKGRTGHL